MKKKIVVIGGGSGSFNILRGLKEYALPYSENKIEISAIITMMDSGGSSGILRDEHGVLPPGDIRRALVALSDETQIMNNLFQYRFKDNLNNHSFGNLFLTALTNILGSEKEAIKKAHKILNVKGNVIPVTLDKAELCAKLVNGKILKRESEIDLKNNNIKIKNIFLKPKPKANLDALKAIKEADTIIVGPGDIYTSIIPNFLVEGITKQINNSSALKIYNCNIMTKYSETDGFSVEDHLKEIKRFVDIDLVIFNKTKFSKEVLKKYKLEKAKPVLIKNKKIPHNFICADFATSPVVRHDSKKIAKILINLIFNYKK